VNIFRAFCPRPTGTFGRLEKRLPEVPAGGVEEVNPSTATWPAPSLVVIFSILLLYKDVKLLCLLVNGVIIHALQVGVYDYDHLMKGMLESALQPVHTTTDFTAHSGNFVGHLHWVREILLVPNHILMVFGILDVQPKDIERHVLLVEALLHTADVVGADVIPATLVVTQRPVRRQRSCAGEAAILSEYFCRGRAGKNEDIKDPRFGDPVSASRLSCRVRNIDPCLGTNGVENGDGRIGGMCVHNWDGTIKGRRPRGEVLEDIGIVESVGIAEEGLVAGGGGQIKRGGMLGDAVNVAVTRKVNIEG
jgi:hypothetical protein